MSLSSLCKLKTTANMSKSLLVSQKKLCPFQLMGMKQIMTNSNTEAQLTSFLSSGDKKGSRTLRPETIVNIGSKQFKIAPSISIFPSLGSIGSIVK